jgi:hypothetical protein
VYGSKDILNNSRRLPFPAAQVGFAKDGHRPDDTIVLARVKPIWVPWSVIHRKRCAAMRAKGRPRPAPGAYAYLSSDDEAETGPDPSS